MEKISQSNGASEGAHTPLPWVLREAEAYLKRGPGVLQGRDAREVAAIIRAAKELADEATKGQAA